MAKFDLRPDTFDAVKPDYLKWLDDFTDRACGAGLPLDAISDTLLQASTAKTLVDCGYVTIESDPAILCEAQMCESSENFLNILLSQLVFDMVNQAATSTNGMVSLRKSIFSDEQILAVKDDFSFTIENIKKYRGQSRVSQEYDKTNCFITVSRPCVLELDKIQLDKGVFSQTQLEEFIEEMLVLEARQKTSISIPLELLDDDLQTFLVRTLPMECKKAALAAKKEEDMSFGKDTLVFENAFEQLASGFNNNFNPFQ